MSAITASNSASAPSIAKQRKNERLLFDTRRMSAPINKYVCWIDVMGSQSAMLRSIGVASNFLMKLHIAAFHSSQTFQVDLYPVIDGLYICSQSQSQILNFVNRVNSRVATTFMLETNSLHKFLIRSGLAYGPVITGSQLLDCAEELRLNQEHTRKILLGPPLTQAYQIEKQSAPFGVALHESVRSFCPTGDTVMSGTYWRWWKSYCRPNDQLLALELSQSLKEHYEWCLKHTTGLSYDKADIERHKALAEEYFSE
jgi:hypothetical protein